MRRIVFLVVAVAVLLSSQVFAGVMCDAAAQYGWASPALNGHCFLEWLWEIGIY